jgi:hypothetical protein
MQRTDGNFEDWGTVCFFATCYAILPSTHKHSIQIPSLRFFILFFYLYIGGVESRSTRHCGHEWPIVLVPGDYDDGEIGGMIGRGKRSTWRKPAPMPLCPPQIPHAARTRTRPAAVGSQRLTACATARPSLRFSGQYKFLNHSETAIGLCSKFEPISTSPSLSYFVTDRNYEACRHEFSLPSMKIIFVFTFKHHQAVIILGWET